MKPRDPEKAAGASISAAVQQNAVSYPLAGAVPVEVDDLPF